MTPKENLYNMYFHKKIEVMPAPAQGESGIYPTSGFWERPPFNRGGTDWFGCRWEDCPGADAPAPDVRSHVLDDICDWKEKVKFPDLDAWDWENAVKTDKVTAVDRENTLLNVIVCTGLFERLHVLMGFEDALCALITDPEETEAYFERMTEYKIELIGKLKQYYNPDVITFHDDWGTQRAMFFSPDLWRKMLKPRMKRIVDYAHSCGIGFIMHSCGKIDEIIPDICEIGVDTLQCMDINNIEEALRICGDNMSIQASVHTQDFESRDSAGILTPEAVREITRREFMEWGASGRYFPFLLPPSKWYEEIVWQEYESCRETLRGTY